jgi:Cu(I)/Ag(I) efflux system membrane protein CusA/SilA
MIEQIIRWSVGNRFLVLLLASLIVVGGIYALKRTPVDAIPDLSDVQVIIKTSYPGQAPQVVEDQVTYPLSTSMLSVPGATTVRGFSFYGDSYIYVIFEEGTDVYWARSRVLEYLSQVAPQLPDSAVPQLGPDASGVGWVYIYSLIDRSGQNDLSELRSIQDWLLKFELQSVAGVAEVAPVGGMVKQYQIVLDPLKLQAYGIPLSHIQTAIRRANQEIGASVIEMAEAEYMLRVSGYIQNQEDLRNIPLGLNSSGKPIMLRDIADIRLGPQMRRGIAELNGQGETVGGIVVMRTGENAQKTIDAVKDKLSELEAALPSGVEIIPVYDRSRLISRAIDNLRSKLLEEFIVVSIVCMLFLFHLRSSLVAIISLPIGILCAYIVMYIQGINANIMSLGGIAIAIGAMIDGAIVMVENMHKHLEHEAENPEPQENSYKSRHWTIVIESASEVGPALFFSLLIITVSFLPVFTLEAQEGRMFSPLAYTKTYAMAASALIAVTLVPVLMGYLVRGKIRSENENPINRLLIKAYLPMLKCVLKYPKSALILAFLILLSGLYPTHKIGSEFMPDLDEGDLMYMPTSYPGLSIGEAREILQQTNKMIKNVPEVESVFGKIGRAETATDPAPLTMIETFIQLKPKEQWRSGLSTDDLKKEFNDTVKVPGLSNAWVMPIKTRIDMLSTGVKTPLGIKISGPDLDVIQEIGQQLETIIQDLNGTVSVYSERVAGGRYIQIDIDRIKAARYGMSVADVQMWVDSLVGGRNLTQTVEGTQRYPVNLRFPQYYRDSPEKLEVMPILGPKGERLLLRDLASVRIEDGPPVIKSENARKSGWVLVDMEGVDFGRYVEEAKLAVENKLSRPEGYTLSWSGQYEYLERVKEKLIFVAPMTLAIIIVLLYLSFRRVSEVVIILSSLPLALVGSLWLMHWMEFNFSVAAAVGIIALAGVSVELAVIMLVFLNLSWKRHQDRARAQGQSIDASILEAAVMEGGAMRVRPKAMTALAIIIGLIPVLLGSGAGSEVMSRIAAPMVGGMISALFLVLIVMPASFFLWHRRSCT